MKHLVAGALLSLLLAPGVAAAQAFVPYGFSSRPGFAAIDPDFDGTRWEGGYARMSSGFQVSSSKRFGSSAGPTLGIEGGKLWREGDLLWGVAGTFDYLSAFGGAVTPGFNRIGWSRDAAGGVQAMVGTFVTPDVLVYTKAGFTAVNETWHVGPRAFGPGFSRSDLVVRPDARVGVEWAVTDKLSVGLEFGATGPAIR